MKYYSKDNYYSFNEEPYNEKTLYDLYEKGDYYGASAYLSNYRFKNDDDAKRYTDAKNYCKDKAREYNSIKNVLTPDQRDSYDFINNYDRNYNTLGRFITNDKRSNKLAHTVNGYLNKILNNNPKNDFYNNTITIEFDNKKTGGLFGKLDFLVSDVNDFEQWIANYSSLSGQKYDTTTIKSLFDYELDDKGTYKIHIPKDSPEVRRVLKAYNMIDRADYNMPKIYGTKTIVASDGKVYRDTSHSKLYRKGLWTGDSDLVANIVDSLDDAEEEINEKIKESGTDGGYISTTQFAFYDDTVRGLDELYSNGLISQKEYNFRRKNAFDDKAVLNLIKNIPFLEGTRSTKNSKTGDLDLITETSEWQDIVDDLRAYSGSDLNKLLINGIDIDGDLQLQITIPSHKKQDKGNITNKGYTITIPVNNPGQEIHGVFDQMQASVEGDSRFMAMRTFASLKDYGGVYTTIDGTRFSLINGGMGQVLDENGNVTDKVLSKEEVLRAIEEDNIKDEIANAYLDYFDGNDNFNYAAYTDFCKKASIKIGNSLYPDVPSYTFDGKLLGRDIDWEDIFTANENDLFSMFDNKTSEKLKKMLDLFEWLDNLYK